MGLENVISLCLWCQLPRADGKETGYSKRHSSIAKIDAYFCCCRLKILKSSDLQKILLLFSCYIIRFLSTSNIYISYIIQVT